MAYTEFYCNASTGSNLNGGSDAGSPSYTATNGGWNSGTGIFTPASGDPSASVTVGQFASVYNDGATVPVFVGRVTARDSTTVTVSTTVMVGTAPTTNATARTIVVGGAWKGPNGTDHFPVSLASGLLVNASGDCTRINMKNGTNYSISSAMTGAGNGPIIYEGYTTTVSDGGRFILDGSGAAAFVLWNVNGATIGIRYAELTSSHSSGASGGMTINGSECHLLGVVLHDVRGTGITSGGRTQFVECEVYLANKSNGALGGMIVQSDSVAIRCIVHNTNGYGFAGSGTSATCINCIADTCTSHGFTMASSAANTLINCDSYNNGGAGIIFSTTQSSYVENCNLINNAGWGIQGITAPNIGCISNCGFGSGTEENTSGTISLLAGSGIKEQGNITYASNVTPWVDPANGDFRIALLAAKQAGRGAFLQTQASYAGAVSYPDIGSAQHLSAAGGNARLIGGGLVR